MKTDKIKEFIENSDLNTLQKNIFTGFLDRMEQIENTRIEDRTLIEQVANEKHLSEVLFSNDEVKIYSIFPSKNDWDVKFPIRSIFINEKGVWQRSCTVSPNFDIAYLVYLEKKYLGENSQFVEFSMKMLGIEIDNEGKVINKNKIC